MTEDRGYGWWTTFEKIDEVVQNLEKMGIPNPSGTYLIDINKEYSPEELRSLLQRFGSYLSILYGLEGKVEGQCHALKEGYKTGLQVALVRQTTNGKTVKDREGEIVSGNDMFLTTRRMEIDNESVLKVIQGYRKSYESAYNTISRLITLMLGEVQHLGGAG
jgi:hypothetical protein